MSLRTQYKTDPALESEGVWVPLGQTEDGLTSSIRLRRMGGANKAFEKALAAGLKPIKAQMEAGVANVDVQSDIVQRAFVATIPSDWENVEDFRDPDSEEEMAIPLTFLPGGRFVEFAPANVAAFFKLLPELYTQCSKVSRELTVYRAELLKAAAGN